MQRNEIDSTTEPSLLPTGYLDSDSMGIVLNYLSVEDSALLSQMQHLDTPIDNSMIGRARSVLNNKILHINNFIRFVETKEKLAATLMRVKSLLLDWDMDSALGESNNLHNDGIHIAELLLLYDAALIKPSQPEVADVSAALLEQPRNMDSIYEGFRELLNCYMRYCPEKTPELFLTRAFNKPENYNILLHEAIMYMAFSNNQALWAKRLGNNPLMIIYEKNGLSKFNNLLTSAAGKYFAEMPIRKNHGTSYSFMAHLVNQKEYGYVRMLSSVSSSIELVVSQILGRLVTHPNATVSVDERSTLLGLMMNESGLNNNDDFFLGALEKTAIKLKNDSSQIQSLLLLLENENQGYQDETKGQKVCVLSIAGIPVLFWTVFASLEIFYGDYLGDPGDSGSPDHVRGGEIASFLLGLVGIACAVCAASKWWPNEFQKLFTEEEKNQFSIIGELDLTTVAYSKGVKKLNEKNTSIQLLLAKLTELENQIKNNANPVERRERVFSGPRLFDSSAVELTAVRIVDDSKNDITIDIQYQRLGNG